VYLQTTFLARFRCPITTRRRPAMHFCGFLSGTMMVIRWTLPGNPTSAARRWAVLVVLVGVAAGIAGCSSVPKNSVPDLLEPSNDRPWKANLAVLPYAKIRDDKVTVYNIRNCTYLDEDTYVIDYYDRTFNPADVQSVDFIVVPFPKVSSLAHTMMSFGFRDGQQLAVSVEVRLEHDETYSPVNGAFHQYEIMYVVADERDVIRLRTEQRNSDVYVYRTVATPEQSRELLLDVLQRVNRLKKHPEFYDTLMNNCTTNIVAHINRINPGRIPWNPTSLLTGYSDLMAYELGLLVDYGSFERTKRRAHINAAARKYADHPRFSQLIRGGADSPRIARQAAPPKPPDRAGH
jgi:hypothetical protein